MTDQVKLAVKGAKDAMTYQAKKGTIKKPNKELNEVLGVC